MMVRRHDYDKTFIDFMENEGPILTLKWQDRPISNFPLHCQSKINSRGYENFQHSRTKKYLFHDPSTVHVKFSNPL